MALLAPFERERADRILAPQAQRQYVLARALLRCLLGERLGVSPEAVNLTASGRGKPILAEPHSASGLRFNASHSEEVAVFVFATGCEVGVDVERVRPLKHAGDIARRFFSPAESEDYFALLETDRALGFMNCWTRKEAFIKAAGEGLYMPLDSFDVSLIPGEDAQLRRIADGDPKDWRIVSFYPFPDFLSAIVTNIGQAQATAA